MICDAAIAPGYEPGVVKILTAKRGGRFLIFERDADQQPPLRERRDVFGVTIEQDRDTAPMETALPDDGRLAPDVRQDAMLGMVTLRYTQSNSVALVREGAALGIGAGQQNRVDCVRLAGSKAQIWCLRRHRLVDKLPEVEGMGRQDRLNWQIRFAGREMTSAQLDEFQTHFGGDAVAAYHDSSWRAEWASGLSGITMASDGYLPFRDNIEHAAVLGVSTIVEPGGSTRTVTSRRVQAPTASG